jgi:hypothetical protein
MSLVELVPPQRYRLSSERSRSVSEAVREQMVAADEMRRRKLIARRAGRLHYSGPRRGCQLGIEIEPEETVVAATHDSRTPSVTFLGEATGRGNFRRRLTTMAIEED